jgi:hypothetical protein
MGLSSSKRKLSQLGVSRLCSRNMRTAEAPHLNHPLRLSTNKRGCLFSACRPIEAGCQFWQLSALCRIFLQLSAEKEWVGGWRGGGVSATLFSDLPLQLSKDRSLWQFRLTLIRMAKDKNDLLKCCHSCQVYHPIQHKD